MIITTHSPGAAVDFLNYHHLLYFWTAAREGSVTKAGESLHVSQSTVSTQIKALEEALGERLFVRDGRTLALTEVGRTVFRYAEEIFSLGREMRETLRGGASGRPPRVVIGVADVVPKLIAHHLIEPALRLPDRVRLECVEDRPDRLLAALAVHEVDIVLSDAPISPQVKVRAYNHLLGESGVSLFGAEKLAAKHRRDFPQGLDQAPFLLPTAHTALRRSLDLWFDRHNVRPDVVGEFDDSALLKTFGQAGVGLFFGPRAIEDEICTHHSVRKLGEAEGVVERFYAISVERKLRHPAVLAIVESARSTLFA